MNKKAIKSGSRGKRSRDRAIDRLVKAYFDDLVEGPVSPKHAELIKSFRAS